ncbi:MAG: hypothetical protein ABR562_05455 [Thermoplasmatota archaeon]
MNPLRSLVPSLLLLALLAPGVHGQAADAYPAIGLANPEQSSNVTLYFHVNGFQEFPINTQPPADWYHQNAGVGLTTSSTSCGHTNGAVDKEYHTSYGFSSPGYVEYNYTPDGTPRIHPERGLSYDIKFDGDGFNLYWYLSTQTGVPPQPQGDPNAAPVVVPNVVVKATLRTGEKITVDDSGYNEGQLVAQGQTAPATLAMQGTTGARWLQVDGLNVYEFRVPMEVKSGTIPKDGGYSLRVDTFMDNPDCNDPSSSGYLMPNLVKIHTSKDYRPRMDVKVFVPIRIEYLHPQFIFDDLVVHTSMNSPWGNYDVDEFPGGIELAIEGPGTASPGACSVKDAGKGCYRAAVVQRYHEHDHHTQAVDVSFVWPFAKDHAADGDYKVHLKVYNDQHTAFALATGQFTLGPVLKVTKCGGLESVSNADSNHNCVEELQAKSGEKITAPPQKSPGLQVLAVVAVLGVAGMAVRRKQA